MLITRQAQTSTNDFLSYLGTDNLTIYHQDDLKYGQFQGDIVNDLTPEDFSTILQAIEQNHSDWEIQQGDNLLLGNNHNQLQLAVGTNRLQLGLQQGELTLGDALMAHWLIEDELDNIVDSNEDTFDFLPYYLALKQSIANFSTSTTNVNQQLTNSPYSQPSLVTSTPNVNQSKNRESFNSSNESTFSSFSDSNNQLKLETLDKTTSVNSFQSNQSNLFQAPAFLHYLFSQLHQHKKLRYFQGQAILTINGETLVAELDEDNQWQYVSGTLSQSSLNQLQHELKSSQSSLKSSSTQSFELTL